jgi:hypothetical protein
VCRVTQTSPSAGESNGRPPVPSAGQERAMIRGMARTYGVMAWYGRATRRWWAVCGGRLVEGERPELLEEAVIRARGWRP